MKLSAVLAGAVLFAALAACGSQPAASPTPSPAAQAQKAAPTSDVIAWSSTGDGSSNDRTNATTYSLKGSDTHGATTRIGHPFAETLTLSHEQHRDLWLQTFGAPNEHVTCSITVNGAEVATNTGSGTATCTWSGQPV